MDEEEDLAKDMLEQVRYLVRASLPSLKTVRCIFFFSLMTPSLQMFSTEKLSLYGLKMALMWLKMAENVLIRTECFEPDR